MPWKSWNIRANCESNLHRDIFILLGEKAKAISDLTVGFLRWDNLTEQKMCPKRPKFSSPGGSGSKEPACNAGDPVSIPGLGRSPREGNGYPLQYSYLKNSMDRESW